MTYFNAGDLRQRAGGVTASAARSELSHSAKSATTGFDVFLSHSVRDAVLVLGLKRLLESERLTVYVDWIEDADLDRNNVSPATAARLRERMRSCRSLVYATSQNASTSRWMPWELGYFDGTHGPERVATCPIDDGLGSHAGAEYVGLYKTLEKVRDNLGFRPYIVQTSGRQAERPDSFVAGRGAYVSLQ
ncbi:toll/interleukin-1 receptor domain-containing protein [Nocardioides astragali]|uniref:Toll/interleukin-1 receptor domain-containing protein n=1 Tax=Nocardioides astragali TaxID=1776736 RepID=A0ABW2N431_9ACTN|nr:toll/interleukin-1 receptor domain-containing protein [Nocardioides astragali]